MGCQVTEIIKAILIVPQGNYEQSMICNQAELTGPTKYESMRVLCECRGERATR